MAILFAHTLRNLDTVTTWPNKEIPVRSAVGWQIGLITNSGAEDQGSILGQVKCAT